MTTAATLSHGGGRAGGQNIRAQVMAGNGVVEPRPASSAADLDPEEYQLLGREPRGFLAFRLGPSQVPHLSG
jgi:hypothetical protein